MRGIRRVNHGRARLAQPGMTSGGYQPVTGGQASPPAIAVMPVAEVLVVPFDDEYATIAYRGLSPIWAPDGETILARSPGRWGQLAAAGRM